MPQVLDRVNIGRLGRSFPPVDVMISYPHTSSVSGRDPLKGLQHKPGTLPMKPFLIYTIAYRTETATRR